MTAKKESIGPVVVLMLPPLNKPLITFARAVLAAMRSNPAFPSPSPTLAVFEANIDAFDEAETKAALRAKGATTFRDARKKTVRENLFHLRDYVQRIAEANPSPADAAALIQSAFMSVKKPYQRATPEISAKNADVSGKVVLAAKTVAPLATYYWEHSLDQSTWTPVPPTMQARTEISGLTSARVHYFRFRALTRESERDYSQVVRLIVR